MSDQSGNFDITKQGVSQPDIVAELVGEGKKFKTVEDLAKGKLESDVFIDRLKTENKALREALDTEGNPDEVLNRITALLNSKDGTKNTTPQTSNQSTKESLSKDEVLALLSEQDKTKQAKNNVDSFNSTVNKIFGDKAGEVVSTRLKDLGLDGQTFTTLVASSPQAALRMIGVTSGQNQGATGVEGVPRLILRHTSEMPVKVTEKDRTTLISKSFGMS